MKKILFVATVDIHIINHHTRIIHKLKQLGNQIDLASLGNYTNDDITNKYNVCFSKNPLSFNNIKAYFEIRKIMKINNYDVVSCHTPLSSFFARLATHGLNIKVIYTAHGFHFYKGCPLVNKLIYRTMESIASKFTDVIVTINQEDYDAANEFKLKKDGKVVFVPGVGIDSNQIFEQWIEKDVIKKELGFEHSDYLIFSIGELNDNKNHSFVINILKEQFAQMTNLHYIVCGDGPLREKLIELIKECDLEKQVHFLGYRTDIYRLLYGMDMFVFPSLREGLPVAILEAMIVGLPILASNVRGNRDLITDGINGLLFDIGDSNQFAEKFNLILGSDILIKEFEKQNRIELQKYVVETIDPLILSLYL